MSVWCAPRHRRDLRGAGQGPGQLPPPLPPLSGALCFHRSPPPPHLLFSPSPCPGRYMRFCQVLQGGSVEEAERLHSELLALLYSIQFHMQARCRLGKVGSLLVAGQ